MKKILAFFASISLLIIALFSYGFFQIFSLKKEIQSLKAVPEGIIKEESVSQEQFQNFESELEAKIQDLDEKQNTNQATFKKMRNAVIKYQAKDMDVQSLKNDILEILKIF